MKKTILFAAVLAMVSVATKAASDVAVSETEVSTTQTAEEPEYKDENTDQAILESHKPLYHAPAPDAEKDFKYWAAAVGSRLKITGYAQGGYEAIFNNGSDNSNTFAMRRVILMVGANITPEFFAFFMHDFKSGNMQEYYMEYRPCKALNFRLGQSKNEFSMENPMSPTVVDLVAPMTQGVFWLNGSDPLMSNGSGRDIGFTVYGDVLGGKLRYVAQVVNGGQINTADKNNQKNVIGKLEYKFMPNLRIGVSGVLGLAILWLTLSITLPYIMMLPRRVRPTVRTAGLCLASGSLRRLAPTITATVASRCVARCSAVWMATFTASAAMCHLPSLSISSSTWWLLSITSTTTPASVASRPTSLAAYSCGSTPSAAFSCSIPIAPSALPTVLTSTRVITHASTLRCK